MGYKYLNSVWPFQASIERILPNIIAYMEGDLGKYKYLNPRRIKTVIHTVFTYEKQWQVVIFEL